MLKKLTSFALILAFTVIVLGAYTRLTDAGLGCPDWPGCYGQVGVPVSEAELQRAQLLYPDAPVEAEKAWTEMVHRYFASTLGLVILLIGFLTFKRQRPIREKALSLGLIGMVVFQGMLGMWTVTLKLFPLVVMAHLLGGLITLSLLWSLWHMQRTQHNAPKRTSPRPWVFASIALLFAQIMLGGWTSANYAALSCMQFPGCQEQFFYFDWQAFNLIGALSAQVPSQYLSLEARQTIHMLHRIGAVVVSVALIALHVMLIRFNKQQKITSIKSTNLMMMGLLLTQVALGITNVLALLPLSVAVAHNAVAILLMLVLIRLAFLIPKRSTL